MQEKPNNFYEIFSITSNRIPDNLSFQKRTSDGQITGYTFSEMKKNLDRLIAGLIEIGVAKGDRILYLCDTTPNWCWVDCAIVSAGAVSVPRGTDVTDDDILYIITHSEASYAVVQNTDNKKRLEQISKKIPTIKQIFVMEESDSSVLHEGANSISSLMTKGDKALKSDPEIIQKRLKETDPEAMATLIYTSGTTGEPKGVMLSQIGWMSAFEKVLVRAELSESDRAVSLLPPWHVFERILEYATVAMGMEYLISDTKTLVEDLKEFKPTFFPSVPRIWEMVYNGIIGKLKKEKMIKQKMFFFFLSIGTIWADYKSILFGYDNLIVKQNIVITFFRRFFALMVLITIAPLKLLAILIFKKIHQALGGKLQRSLSAGSALPRVVDIFLSGIGILVLEGYGMTETSAGIAIRRVNKPTPGTIGPVLEGVELKLIDESGKDVSDQPGMKGTLWLKAEQNLMGYYKRPKLNKEIFDSEGFFNTGDIMSINCRGDLIFTGRAKDTIVLTGGENVEPVPIEDKLISSEYIDQVMAIGDDKKNLGALIVPNFELVKAKIDGIPEDTAAWNGDKAVRALFKSEITRLISRDAGFKRFELLPGNCFYILPNEFDKDTEMTRTLKMKRLVIKSNYEKEINNLYR